MQRLIWSTLDSRRLVAGMMVIGLLLIFAMPDVAYAQSSSKVFCGSCGTQNDGSKANCTKCDAKLQTVDLDKSTTSQQGKQTYCGNCGKANATNKVKCSSCGELLPVDARRLPPPTSKHCGKCGTESPVTSSNCGNCGEALPELAVLAGLKSAEPPPENRPSKGSTKLSFGGWVKGSMTDSGGSGYGSTSIMASYGHFFANRWEIGGDVVGTFTWSGGSYSSSMGTFNMNGTVTYYFISEKSVVPYLTGKAGFETSVYDVGAGISSSDGAGSLGFKAGLNIFLGESSNSFFIEYDHDTVFNSNYMVFSHTMRAGLSLYFTH